MFFFGAVGALASVDGVWLLAWQRAGPLVAVLLLLAAAGHSGPNLIFSFHWSLRDESFRSVGLGRCRVAAFCLRDLHELAVLFITIGQSVRGSLRSVAVVTACYMIWPMSISVCVRRCIESL
ncbi:MAG: hypothetical protein QOF74_7417 [Caballeronia mineralivorans]|jgi:hypothetical protein|nr:hypothetical protein [Caballeronia mineralivorans]